MAESADAAAGVGAVVPRPLSALIAGLGALSAERISLADAAAALSDRGYAALLILLSAPNLLPLPPGSSTVFGIPMILIASQLLLGRRQAWLPGSLGRRSVDRESYRRIAKRIAPLLRRLEVLARPRLWPRTAQVADRLVGALALAMGLVLVLPIPFGNLLPALAVLVSGLALAERDGLWLIAGLGIGASSIGLLAGLASAVEVAASWLFR